jgi:hypothetical protein
MPLDYTVDGSAADSYVSLAEADGFAASDIGRFAKAYADAPIETKEAALRRAAREIDAYVGISPDEAYYYGVQARAFPRVRDIDYVTSLPEIPTRVKFAQYLQAAYLCAVADQIDEAAARRAKGFSNYVNPDGTGGSLSGDKDFGRFHPDFIGSLGSFDEGATVGRIILR